MSPESDPKLEALLAHLKRARGFDFTGYKRSTLSRRIQKRMDTVHVENFVDYIDYLEVHPDEFNQLFNTILINVTRFFRDQEAWTYLQENVIPDIVKSSHGGNIRIWDVGCASGEEAYSLAISFAEQLGADAFQEKVKIYATDLDEDALYEARQANFNDASMQNVPEDLRTKYFAKTGNRCSFRSDLRRNIIFGKHDLVQDAPISHLSLLVCRNTLMYMNADTQSRILNRFHYALNDDAYLFLGKAETLLAHSEFFQPVDLKNRIFKKTARKSARDHGLINHAGEPENFLDTLARSRMRELSFDAGLIPQLVIDSDGSLVLANHSARMIFNLREEDLNQPVQNLEISYRPLELRSLIEKACTENRAIKVPKVERQVSDKVQFFDVEISPLPGDNQTIVGVNVSFTDVTAFHQIYDDLIRANQEFETSNEELSSAHEELETTNEELQSTNEELETTNEEMQSTNEELETMNEELQATNEELESTAQELRYSGVSLNLANSFLDSILSSLRSAIIVVDDELTILVWNERAEDIWGLRRHEAVGTFLHTLDLGFPVDKLKDAVRSFLRGSTHFDDLLLDGINRKGKTIACKVRISPLIPTGPLLAATNNQHYKGVVIMIDEVLSKVDAQLT
ncbi:PAS domain-containing protein [soil metagenome]